MEKGGLPFSVVSCDCLYGRDSQFRADVDSLGVTYMADKQSIQEFTCPRQLWASLVRKREPEVVRLLVGQS
ncbi:MAG: hypothetical protein AB4426_22720 [Xenococcaceae cyanobacterium]